MSESRLADYLEHIQQAATDACGFVDGLAKADFLEDTTRQTNLRLGGLVKFRFLQRNESLALMPAHP